jgi:hypothetical protein
VNQPHDRDDQSTEDELREDERKIREDERRVREDARRLREDERELRQDERALREDEEALRGEDAGPFSVIFNKTNVVVLPRRIMTGLQIKAAAIEQGVKIKEDFVLSVVRKGKWDIVGDRDEVRIHEGQKFAAVAPDDNS